MAVVVAQLAEWLLPTPEFHGLNPIIGNFFKNTYLLTVNCTGKTKIKKKRPGMAHLKNNGRSMRSKFITADVGALYSLGTEDTGVR